MKIALDENIPPAVVKMLENLARDPNSQHLTIISARRYRPPGESGDQNWVKRFRRARGTVVVTGDKRIRGNLHEQAAFFEAGMVVFFFEPAWNEMPLNSKSAMLMQWWPTILEQARKSRRGDFWEIPCSWNIKEMRSVTPPKNAIAKHAPKSR